MYENGTNIGNVDDCDECRHYERVILRLDNENAKLRELVKQAWTAMKHTRMACEDGVCDRLIVDAIAAIDAAFYPPNAESEVSE